MGPLLLPIAQRISENFQAADHARSCLLSYLSQPQNGSFSPRPFSDFSPISIFGRQTRQLLHLHTKMAPHSTGVLAE